MFAFASFAVRKKAATAMGGERNKKAQSDLANVSKESAPEPPDLSDHVLSKYDTWDKNCPSAEASF